MDVPSSWSECYAPLIGRIFVGGYFLWTGILNAFNFSAAVGSLDMAGFPAPTAWVSAAIVIQILFGLALVIGWKARASALVLAIYTITATLVLYGNLNEASSTPDFLKNMAILGGLLYMSAYGSGHWSLEKHARE